MHVTHPLKTTGAPVINFAAGTGPKAAPCSRKSSLSALIDNLIATKNAAETACAKQGDTETKFSFNQRSLPKVFGGMTDATTITRADKTDEIPSMEWYYSSREEIEKHETGKRRAALLAEFSRQQKACQSSYPRALRAAERAATKALHIWTAAEQALVHYRPTSAAEAIELLALAGRPTGRNATLYLEIDEADLRSIVRTCAAVLQKDLQLSR
jgi:hypothetical protein